VKLSVALCTYNGARFLPEQLRSISEQTRPPDELVICDDQSRDATNEVVGEFARKATFAVRRYVNEQRLGPARNFEKAIALCRGDVIALSDQDDVWSKRKLELLLEQIDGNPNVAMAFSDAELVDERLCAVGRRAWDIARFDEEEQQRFRRGEGFAILAGKCVVTGATMAFPSRLRGLILPIPLLESFAGRSGHDAWIAILATAVGDVVPVPEPLIKYRLHPGQVIGFPIRDEESSALESAPAPRGRLRPRVRRGDALWVAGFVRPVLERLHSRGAQFEIKPSVQELMPKIEHFEARASLPPSRWKRPAVVARELVGGRYHRYGKGLRSAAKDLLIPLD
jgi:Glycosyl transferase family 2